jgi:hypothetical protein
VRLERRAGVRDVPNEYTLFPLASPCAIIWPNHTSGGIRIAARTSRTRPLIFAATALAAITLTLALSGPARAGSPTAYADPGGTCASLTPCYTTIQGAVNHAGGPTDAEVLIFPGTYNESVNLDLMASQFNQVLGGIALTAVNILGVPTAGSAIIHGATPITAAAFPHSVTLDGLTLQATTGDGALISTTDGGAITITNSAANDPGDGVDGGDETGDDGFDLTTAGGGVVTITGSQANNAKGEFGDGIQVKSSGGVSISGGETDENSGTNDNDGVDIYETAGDVAIDNFSSSSNSDSGIFVETSGDITFTRGNSADLNGSGGLEMSAGGGSISIESESAIQNGGDGMRLSAQTITLMHVASRQNHGFGIFALGDLDASNVDASGNTEEGIVAETGGSISIDRGTLSGNGGDGLFATWNSTTFVQSVSVTNSLITDNGNNGVLINDAAPAGSHVISSNVICGNDNGGLDVNSPNTNFDGSGNWWGDASGPTHSTNPGGSGDKVFDGQLAARGTVHYKPFISTIEETELAGPAAATGVEGTVAFTFGSDDRSAFLEDGPGADVADPPFTVTTDNGLVNAHGSPPEPVAKIGIEDTQARAGLTAAHDGEAHLALDGPCGLDKDVTVHVGAGAIIRGDLNCNGMIDTGDLLRSLRFTGDADIGTIDGCDNGSIAFFDLDCNDDPDAVDPLLLVLYLGNVTPAAGLLPNGCAPVGTVTQT